MQKFNYTVKSPIGMHARPAGILAQEAGKFQSVILITKNGRSVDARRLFSLISLEVVMNDELIVTIEGSDEEEAANAIKEFLHQILN